MRKFVVSLAVLAVLGSSAHAWEKGENRGEHSERSYDGSERGDRATEHFQSNNVFDKQLSDKQKQIIKAGAFNEWAEKNGYDYKITTNNGKVYLEFPNDKKKNLTKRYEKNPEKLEKDLKKVQKLIKEHGKKQHEAKIDPIDPGFGINPPADVIIEPVLDRKDKIKAALAKLGNLEAAHKVTFINAMFENAGIDEQFKAVWNEETSSYEIVDMNGVSLSKPEAKEALAYAAQINNQKRIDNHDNAKNRAQDRVFERSLDRRADRKAVIVDPLPGTPVKYPDPIDDLEPITPITDKNIARAIAAKVYTDGTGSEIRQEIRQSDRVSIDPIEEPTLEDKITTALNKEPEPSCTVTNFFCLFTNNEVDTKPSKI